MTLRTSPRVFGVSRGDGELLWEIDLVGAICAEQPLNLPDGGTAVACAGTDQITVVATATGEVVAEIPRDWAATGIAATADGAVVVGVTDERSGATPIAWVSASGDLAWQDDLVRFPEFSDSLWWHDDIVEAWRMHAVALEEMVLLQHEGVTFPVRAEGLGSPFQCWSIWIGAEGLACTGDVVPEVTVGYSEVGVTAWEGPGMLVAARSRWQVPIPLVRNGMSDDEPGVWVLDPATGSLGREVIDVQERPSPSLRGTAEVPLLEYDGELYRLTPNGEEVLWQVPLGEHNEVVVFGDRVLVSNSDSTPSRAYLFAVATGEAIAQVPPLTAYCHPIEGRQALCIESDGVRLVTMP